MRITVFGATGATGRKVVERALELGHEVRAVTRRPEVLTPTARLSIHQGDVLNASSIAKAFGGMDAVISCIGPARNFSPGTVVPVGVSNIVAECQQARVRRFVLQSGITLSDGSEFSALNRWAVRVLRRVFSKACDDKALAERAVQQCDLDWVIVRPAGLRDVPPTWKYTAGPKARITPLRPLSFADCADCLVRATSELTWVRQIVNVGR